MYMYVCMYIYIYIYLYLYMASPPIPVTPARPSRLHARASASGSLANETPEEWLWLPVLLRQKEL